MIKKKLFMKTLKIVVVGDNSVGKTWLIITFLTNETPNGYVSTIFDNFGTKIKYKNEYYNLSIYDTAGTSEWSKVCTLSYQQAEVFIVCFAVNNIISFNNAVKLIHDLKKIYDIPIILCATKTDLRDDRIVDPKVSNHISVKSGCYKYVETSALEFKNVKKVFDIACEAVIDPKITEQPCFCGIFFCCKRY